MTAGAPAVLGPLAGRPRGVLLAPYAALSAVLVGTATAIAPLAGAACVAAVAFGALVLRHPAAGAYVLVALAPALSGIARGVPVPGLRLSEMLIGGLSVLILVNADRGETVPWRAFDWIALVYVASTALLGAGNVIAHGGDFSADTFGTLAGPLQYLLLYRAVLTALPEPAQRRRALRWLVAGSVPVALVALAQGYGLPGVQGLIHDVTGSNLYESSTLAGFTERATGPFPHWHQLGGYLLLILLLGIGLLIERGGGVMPVPALAAIVALDLVALILTATFSPLFGVLVGAVVLGFWSGRRAMTLGAVGLALAVTLVFFGPALGDRLGDQYERPASSADNPLVPQTLQYRSDLWSESYFPVLEDHWVAGFGPTLPPNATFPWAESLYLTLLFRGGIVLLLVFAALMIAWGAAAFARTRARDPAIRVAARATVIALVVLALVHVIEPYFLDSGPPHVLWAMAGVLFGAGARRGPALGRPGRSR
jgi:O-Antigen ligase